MDEAHTQIKQAAVQADQLLTPEDKTNMLSFALCSGDTHTLLRHLQLLAPTILPLDYQTPEADLLSLLYNLAPTLRTPDEAYNFLKAAFGTSD